MGPSKPLPIDEQIELINRAIESFKISPVFLCCEIELAFNCMYSGCFKKMSEIKEYIPLFTKKNALEHSNAEIIILSPRDAWWKSCPFDVENRLSFLNWILSELKKQKILMCENRTIKI